MPAPITQALLSVSDKTGLVAFARGLAGLGIKLLSTGGTAKALSDAGLAVTEIGDYTGFPEMLDGRVKTLHPKVHAGILARRDLAEHAAALEAHAIPLIDLVVVNLYPFRETVAKEGCTLDDAIENIDIGGPTLLRAAAKNWKHVGVIVEPADYDGVLAELAQSGRALSATTRFALAQKAFSHTASYDGAISNWLTARDVDGAAAPFPERFNLQAVKVQDLRYGENPHQEAAFYRDERPSPGTIATYRQLQGQGAVVQQPRGFRCRVGMREIARLRRSGGVRHRQARESLRRRGCGHSTRRLPECVRDRPGFCVRRHHRVRSTHRRGDARDRFRPVPGSPHRAGLHGRTRSR
jgi:phosphoribosylaminoimidazolecarboxamide formyltransferase/IMP cyclohydrolase